MSLWVAEGSFRCGTRELTLRLAKPEAKGSRWECTFVASCDDWRASNSASGEDSLQSLLLAIVMATVTIRSDCPYGPVEGLDLTSLGLRLIETQFPG